MTKIIENTDLENRLAIAFAHSIEGLLTLDPKQAAKEFLSESRAIEQLELFRTTIEDNFTGKKILEIGAGVGTLIITAIKKYNMEAFGIEPSADEFSGFREISSILFKENNLSANLILNCEAEKLPFENESFDLIYSSNVIEHVNDPEKVFNESLRVLKPGGYLQFVIPNYFSFWEGHYGVLWPCIINKFIGKIYVKLIGKNPAYVDTLKLINPFYLKNILNKHTNEIEIIGWGKNVFKNRLASGNYSDWAALKKIRPIVNLIQKMKIASLVANILNVFEMYTPIIITIKKLK